MRASTAHLRKRILSYVKRRILEGQPPTIREVQEAFGFAAVESARQHLKALVEAGELLQVSGRSRVTGSLNSATSSAGRSPSSAPFKQAI